MPSSTSAERKNPTKEASPAQTPAVRKRSTTQASTGPVGLVVTTKPATLGGAGRSGQKLTPKPVAVPTAAEVQMEAEHAAEQSAEQKATLKSAKARAVQRVEAGFLESLMGYTVRRASLAMVSVFMKGMAQYDLKIVEFSVLSLVASNPGITSRQLCKELDLLPPNMAVMMDSLVQRGYVQRRPHPSDGRATGLYLSPQGEGLIATAQPQLKASEEKAVAHLSEAEQKMLIELLRKLYH